MSQRLKAWVHDFFINPRLSWELLLLGAQCSFDNCELLTQCSTWDYFFHMRIFLIPSSVVQFIRIVSYYKIRIAYCTTTTSFLSSVTPQRKTCNFLLDFCNGKKIIPFIYALVSLYIEIVYSITQSQKNSIIIQLIVM